MATGPQYVLYEVTKKNVATVFIKKINYIDKLFLMFFKQFFSLSLVYSSNEFL